MESFLETGDMPQQFRKTKKSETLKFILRKIAYWLNEKTKTLC
jgi:hypothetical protein